MIGFGAGEPDFPTPEPHRRGGRRRLPRPAQPPVHAGRRAARAPRRRSPRRRCATPAIEVRPSQVLVTNGGKHAVYNAFQTLLDPGDEVLLACAVLDHLPRGDPARRRRAGRACRPTRRPDSGSRSSSSRRRARRGRRCCCSCRRPTRPARSTRPTRSRRSAAGRVEHGIWVVTDEIYEHLTTADAQHVVDADRGARARPTTCVVLNGVAKTYAMTGWRVGWMIGPRRRRSRRRPTCSRTRPRTSPTCRSAARARRGPRRPVSGPGDARRVRSAPADDARDALGIPGVVCPEPQGAFYCFPSFEGVLGRELRGRVATHVRSLAS